LVGSINSTSPVDETSSSKDSRCYPFGYFIVERKTEDSYARCLQVLKEITYHKIEFENVVTDFEIAYQSAVKTVFPNAHNTHCLFHLLQGIILILLSKE
jgi:hypothetical protein